MTNRELAEKIAAALFIDHAYGLKAVRLQVKLGEGVFVPVEEEVDGGGWCFKAAVNEIEKVLQKELEVKAGD